MKKHITILLATWGILATVLALYFWNSYQQEMKNSALLTESIALHKKAIGAEVKSYYLINDCFVVNKGLCDPEEFSSNLQSIEDESNSIYDRIELTEKTINELK